MILIIRIRTRISIRIRIRMPHLGRSFGRKHSRRRVNSIIRIRTRIRIRMAPHLGRSFGWQHSPRGGESEVGRLREGELQREDGRVVGQREQPVHVLVLGNVAEHQRRGGELDSGENTLTNKTWEQRIGGGGLSKIEREK